ncbi:hypothetical protein VN97_g392 [Penicillium thymicola]|uniref:Uncharacterized protein n=1 Tax=Penicillium thymicola TaxID=293382 RepID=A0AAI9TSW8_PENTH|nr:hypothetical protein VN97_g392 [Penicillium thymicola]
MRSQWPFCLVAEGATTCPSLLTFFWELNSLWTESNMESEPIKIFVNLFKGDTVLSSLAETRFGLNVTDKW